VHLKKEDVNLQEGLQCCHTANPQKYIHLLMGHAFPFLDLPPEIRENVYIHLSTDPRNHVPLSYLALGTQEEASEGELLHPHFQLDLLLVCHQIYQEVRPLYFHINAFALTLTRHNVQLDYFFAPSFMDNRRQIRSLLLTIGRWGRQTYFLDTVVPVLEDMILNGSLRVLEVRAKESHLFKAAMGYSINRNAVAALLRICEDPYLERVKLVTYLSDASESGVDHLRQIQDVRDLRDVTSVFNRVSLP
jgi:hypothetical protein